MAEENDDQGTPDGENPTLTTPISPTGPPETGAVYQLPARQGRAARLTAGETLRIVNTHGTQVCDFWAFSSADPREFLSMEHLRGMLQRTIPRRGDALFTNRRRPIMTLTADTTPGIHDTVIAACDIHRYRLLGVDDYHDNCTDNLRMALLAIGERAREIPCPFNIFMNIPIHPDHSTEWGSPVCGPGDYVELRAETDCIAVMSACPQDIIPVNGVDATPVDLHFFVRAGDEALRQ